MKVLREQLATIQVQLRDPTQYPNLFEQEKLIKNELEKWDNIEESIAKQKLRVQWLQIGDSNIAYFYASIKIRLAQKNIHSLQNSRGDMKEGIYEELVGFYKSLLGCVAEYLAAVSMEVTKEGPYLNRDRQLALIAPVQRWRL